MDDEAPPLYFANHVLQQLIQHMFGLDIIIEPEDYDAIRKVFRQCGGRWEELVGGSMLHIGLLQKVVVAWGKMPNRKKAPAVMV